MDSNPNEMRGVSVSTRTPAISTLACKLAARQIESTVFANYEAASRQTMEALAQAGDVRWYLQDLERQKVLKGEQWHR